MNVYMYVSFASMWIKCHRQIWRLLWVCCYNYSYTATDYVMPMGLPFCPFSRLQFHLMFPYAIYGLSYDVKTYIRLAISCLVTHSLKWVMAVMFQMSLMPHDHNPLSLSLRFASPDHSWSVTNTSTIQVKFPPHTPVPGPYNLITWLEPAVADCSTPSDCMVWFSAVDYENCHLNNHILSYM